MRAGVDERPSAVEDDENGERGGVGHLGDRQRPGAVGDERGGPLGHRPPRNPYSGTRRGRVVQNLQPDPAPAGRRAIDLFDGQLSTTFGELADPGRRG